MKKNDLLSRRMVILIFGEHGRLMPAFDYVWQESARWKWRDQFKSTEHVLV